MADRPGGENELQEEPKQNAPEEEELIGEEEQELLQRSHPQRQGHQPKILIYEELGQPTEIQRHSAVNDVYMQST